MKNENTSPPNPLRYTHDALVRHNTYGTGRTFNPRVGSYYVDVQFENGRFRSVHEFELTWVDESEATIPVITNYREETYGYFLDTSTGQRLGINIKEPVALFETHAGSCGFSPDNVLGFEIRSAHNRDTLGISLKSGTFFPIGIVQPDSYTEAQDWMVIVNRLYKTST